MTNKARHRLAAQAHKRLLRAVSKLRRETERELRRLYPVRVGQRYVNATGGRYIVLAVDYGVDINCRPWPQGPCIILKADASEFDLKVVKFWDELTEELSLVKPSKG